MPKPPALPIEAHDYFRQANVLHGYVQKDMTNAVQHALETGQVLMLAKKTVPHGRWEEECSRLFDGSVRTAQAYMRFARNVSALPKAQAPALLLLESTLEGAAKAAKEAVAPPPETPAIHAIEEPPPAADEAPVEDVGATPSSEPEDVDPFEDAGIDPFDFPEEPQTNGNGQPTKQYEPEVWLNSWNQAIAPTARLVDKVGESIGALDSPNYRSIHDHLRAATQDMMILLGIFQQ